MRRRPLGLAVDYHSLQQRDVSNLIQKVIRTGREAVIADKVRGVVGEDHNQRLSIGRIHLPSSPNHRDAVAFRKLDINDEHIEGALLQPRYGLRR